MPVTPLSLSRQVAAIDTSHTGESRLDRVLSRPSVFLFVILTAQLMVVLDSTVVNVALPHIQARLGFSGTSLSWVLNAYILTFGGMLLLGARAGDLLGRRRVFLAGIAVFTVSSMLGGLAVTSWMLLAARALQGIGGALAAPSALSLLTTTFREGARRVRAIALYTTMSAAGAATGLVAGGLLTEWASWRAVMFVNVPIGLVVFLVGRKVLVETERRYGRFDLAGALTSTLGMSGIVLGLVEAGTKGWGSADTLAPLFAGAVLLGLFGHVEHRASEPILPLRLLAHRTRSAANAARGLVYAGMYGMFFFMSQFLQDVDRYSPIRAGVSFLPLPISVFLSSQVTSRVLVRRLPPRSVIMSGIGLSFVGLTLSTLIHAGTPYVEILPALVLLGAGTGMSFVSLTSASLADVSSEDAGAASGLVNVSQQIGGALGLAVLVTVFGAVTHHVQVIAGLHGAVVRAADATFIHGLHDAFGVGALFALSAFTLVGALVDRRPRMAEPIPVVVPQLLEGFEDSAA